MLTCRMARSLSTWPHAGSAENVARSQGSCVTGHSKRLLLEVLFAPLVCVAGCWSGRGVSWALKMSLRWARGILAHTRHIHNIQHLDI